MRRTRTDPAAHGPGASIFVLAALCVALTAGAAQGSPGFPRVTDIYFPILADATPEELARLARYDVLVVAASNGYWAPEQLAAIRELNPEIVILPHTCFSYHGGWTAPPLHAQYLEALDSNNWWLRDTSGEICRVPNGNGLVNMTTNCPVNAQGQRLCDWLGDYLASELGPGGPWDGVFLDCVWDDIRWYARQLEVPVDSDLDGVADDLNVLDEIWRDATAIAVARIRDLVGDDYLIVTNGGNTLWDDVNGTMLERFPEQPNGWYVNITHPEFGYVANDTNFREPRFNIVNTVWYQDTGGPEPVWSGYFVRRFLYTLASTLVFGDGYYTMTSDDYDSAWWFAYYDLDLGLPLGSAEDAIASPGDAPGVELGDMIKIRRFSEGVAVVNPSDVYQSIQLPGAYYDPEEAVSGFFPLSSVATEVAMSYRTGRVLVGTGTLRPAAMGSVSALFDGRAVDVLWNGPVWASRYTVYRSGVRGDGSMTDRILLWVGDATEFQDTRVEPGRRYAYFVSPIDADGYEGWPGAPAIVSAETAGSQSVALMIDDLAGVLVLSWNVPDVPDEMVFELERRDEGGRVEPLGRFTGRAGETLQFIDRTATPGQSARYELFETTDGGRRLVAWAVARAPEAEGRPTTLLACRPQPVSVWPATISFSLGDDDNWDDGSRVRLTVYDIRGRVIRRLVDRRLPRGEHSVEWDGRDGDGRPVPSGCYLYALDIGGERLTGKAVVIR